MTQRMGTLARRRKAALPGLLMVWTLLTALVFGSPPDSPVRNDQGVFTVPGSGSLAGAVRPAASTEDRPVDEERASSRNEVSVAAHPSKPKVVLAAMHDFAENNSAQGPAVVVYLSRDGGDTYERTAVFAPFVSEVWTADPSVAFDNRGRAYIAFLQGVTQDSQGTYKGGGLFVARSDDGGRTWGKPRLAAPSVDQGHCGGPDKPFLGVGPARTGPDVLYLSWQEHQSSDPSSCQDFGAGTIVKVARSLDGGRSFSSALSLSALKEQAFGSMPRVDVAGRARVSFLVPGGSGCPDNPNFSVQMVLATSRDEGRSFSRSVVDETCSVGVGSNGAALAANSIPLLDVSSSGKLAMVWGAGEGDSDNRLEVAVSANGGVSWKKLPDIGSGPAVATLQAWPAFGPDGRLHVMYLGAAPGGLYDAYVTSFAGRSWSEPVKLSSAPSIGTGVNAGFGLGHYQGFDVGVDGVGHAMWTDARGTPAMYHHDIWTRSVPLKP